MRYRDTDQNQNFIRSITLFIKSPLFYNLEPVRGGGWFWPGSAGDGGEESQPNVLCGSARETVGAPQAWPEEALHCRGKPLLDGPWDAIWSVSLHHSSHLHFGSEKSCSGDDVPNLQSWLSGKSYDERVDIFSFGIIICEVKRHKRKPQSW